MFKLETVGGLNKYQHYGPMFLIEPGYHIPQIYLKAMSGIVCASVFGQSLKAGIISVSDQSVLHLLQSYFFQFNPHPTTSSSDFEDDRVVQDPMMWG